MAVTSRRRRTWTTLVQPPSLKRVQTIPDSQLSAHLDTATMSLGMALDAWRYQGAPSTEVERSIEAIAVLWAEVERRGIGK